MHTGFYGLAATPFALTPDSRFFFQSANHRKAVAHLMFGLDQHEGFVVMIGEVGAGKTATLNYLLDTIDPGIFVAGAIAGGRLQGDDMVRVAAAGLGVEFHGNDKATLLRDIEECCAANRQRGLHTLLAIDEAQELDDSALEELRLLSNFQHGFQPALQIILMAQPRFRRRLATGDFRSLRQRVVSACYLGPMDAADTAEYLRHRLGVAGWQNDPQLTDDALDAIFAHTAGLPRRVNLFCSRLLVFAALDNLHSINREVVLSVAADWESEIDHILAAPFGEHPADV
jgi:general secretion pathway protein A